jgi:F-type H+-transporting ATPase subunit a
LTLSVLLEGAEGGFTPPSSADFEFAPIWGNSILATKPVLMVGLSVIIVATFFIVSARKAAIVPSRIQFLGEGIYGFVRKSLGEEVIGPEFHRFMPFLFTVFTFILTNNWFGFIPFLQFPTMSHIGFPLSITIFTYLVYHYTAVKHQGFIPYMKHVLFMPGVPKPVYVILTPIEFATYFIVRPLTLTMRLFANMFAGHLLLLVFILGGEHLIMSGALLKVFGVGSFAMSIVLSFFEFGVQALQAYIFTLLTSLYIAGSVADEH